MKKTITSIGLAVLLSLSGASYATTPATIKALNLDVQESTVLSHHCCHCHCHCCGSTEQE